MKNLNMLLVMVAITCLSSCSDEFWLQRAGTGMGGYGLYGGYGMGGYQVYPGGFVRNTSYDYLLDPRYAIMRVNQQNQQEYLQQTNGGKTMTYDEWYAKIKAPSISGSVGSGGSGTSSSSRTTSSKMCRLCAGSGKCNTCNGKGYYYNEFDLSKKVLCPNCPNRSGKCSSCRGTGKQ